MATTTASSQPSLRIAVAVVPGLRSENQESEVLLPLCAAKLNNVLAPKRRLGGSCSVCGCPIPRQEQVLSCKHRPNHTA